MTVFGISTLVMIVQPKKARSAMEVTGKPSMVSGMMIGPPGPLYPVMATVPAVVV